MLSSKAATTTSAIAAPKAQQMFHSQLQLSSGEQLSTAPDLHLLGDDERGAGHPRHQQQCRGEQPERNHRAPSPPLLWVRDVAQCLLH